MADDEGRSKMQLLNPSGSEQDLSTGSSGSRRIKQKQLIKTKSSNSKAMVELVAEDDYETIVKIRYDDGREALKTLDEIIYDDIEFDDDMSLGEVSYAGLPGKDFVRSESNASSVAADPGKVKDKKVKEEKKKKKSKRIDYNDLPSVPGVPGGNTKPEEFDYQVVFHESHLGLELEPTSKGNKNALVTGFTNKFAAKHVHHGSLLVAVNKVWLIGKTITTIEDIIISKVKQPPLILRFRGKRWMKNFNLNEGQLVIRVNKGMKLCKSATHVSIEVDKKVQQTVGCQASKEPKFDECLCWKPFVAKEGQTATLTVQQQNKFLPNSTVGTGTFKLPHQIRAFEDINVDIKNSKNEKTGSVHLHIMFHPRKLKKADKKKQVTVE